MDLPWSAKACFRLFGTTDIATHSIIIAPLYLPQVERGDAPMLGSIDVHHPNNQHLLGRTTVRPCI